MTRQGRQTPQQTPEWLHSRLLRRAVCVVRCVVGQCANSNRFVLVTRLRFCHACPKNRGLSVFRSVCLLAALAAVSFVPAGCSTANQAGLDTLSLLNPWHDPIREVTLNPQVRYLRVTVSGKPSLFALGYQEVVKDSESIDQIWYSKAGEMIRIRDDRLMSVLGVSGELKRTAYEGLPRDWASVSVSMTFTRVRDLDSPYAHRTRERVTLMRVPAAAPAGYRTQAGQGYRLSDLVWFEERYQAESTTGVQPGDRSLFGVLVSSKQARVVYSEQCARPGLCLTMQEWMSQ